MACKIVGVLALIVVGVLMLASLMGVYMSHAGWTFGTTEGGVAIVAALLCVKVFKKMFRKVCPCGKACNCGPETK